MDQTQLSYLVIALTGAVLLWRRLRAYLETKKPFPELPMAPRSHFLLGHLPLMGKPFQEYLRIVAVDHANESGLTGYWLASTPVVAILNWEDAYKVLLNEFYRKPVPLLAHHLDHFLGRFNILNLMGRQWKVQRTVITKAFLPAHNAEYHKIMAQVTQSLVTSLREKLEGTPEKSLQFDLEGLMKMVTVDVFGLATFDTDFKCCQTLNSAPFADSFDYLSGDFTHRIRNAFSIPNLLYGLPTERNRRHAQAFQMIRSFCIDKIQARRQAGGSDDLLSRLVKGQEDAKEHGGEISNELLTDVVMSLQFAGYETTSLALVYSFYCLSTHPEVEEKCLQEIESLDSMTNADDLAYCTGVVMEALRLFPPAFINSRCLQKPLKLSGGFVVPEGAVAMIPIWELHRQESVWPQAETFRPDRWAKRSGDRWVERSDRDEDDSACDIAAGNRKAFFAFSAGGRSCPGANFAVHEATLVMAGLLKDFKFRLQPGYKLNPVRDGVVQHPEQGMPMTIEFRKTNLK